MTMFVCTKKCYHGGRIWRVGETFVAEEAPNKHFTESSEIPEEEAEEEEE